jgi:hypothetical protein
MSRKITFRGQLADGLTETIKLATLNGKTGYRIKNFKIIVRTPGQSAAELVCQVYSKQTDASAVVDYTNGDLLAVALYMDEQNNSYHHTDYTIFETEVFNQDICVTAVDASGSSQSTNYYIELETVPLSDIQATQLTLKNLRKIASR